MRPPYFAFYPADFADDIKVESMSTTAVGAYILLLCKAWQSEPPASLPNNDQILARLARLNAVDWAEVKAAVLACFELRTDGRWHQSRLRREYDTALRRIRCNRDRTREARKVAEQLKENRQTRKGPPVTEAVTVVVTDYVTGFVTGGRLEIGDKDRENATHSLSAADAGGKKEPPKRSKVAKKPREPNPLFDAIAEVTGSDPKASGGHVGKVRSALARAEPPYTPEEVREFGRRFREFCPWAAKNNRLRPELGELEKHIGKLRANKPAVAPPTDPHEQRRKNLLAQVSLGNMTRQEAETQFGGPLNGLDTATRPAA